MADLVGFIQGKRINLLYVPNFDFLVPIHLKRDNMHQVLICTTLKIDFVVNRLHVERKAASRYLKELEAIGILQSQKVGRETLYINMGLIEILKE
jgi:predicted transcriptional regulator